ncbi:indolepyruvate oxidoreductase subunit beta [Limisalsivibrio acetivorans]|uniref:indolepyruvate oxidoreductase subunit beta n=1 Tax=Limisalsivibrio acetivorans TaxID=1304888 RepID=UPI0003B52F8A|nr:indolepyruvate oxidoreductase subunit beta [Limisalsivibrio acetivorans]
MKDYDILMVGVGGQGTVLSSDIVCEVALAGGSDVKKSEIHGMAQRGGSVVSHVRIGKRVSSPVLPLKGADIILSFEDMEFLRYPEYVNDETVLILNRYKIYPPSVASGDENYPESQVADLKDRFSTVFEMDAMEMAQKIGNPKVAGMVLLGKLASLLHYEQEVWKEVVSKKVPPKTVELNLKAFDAGFGS